MRPGTVLNATRARIVSHLLLPQQSKIRKTVVSSKRDSRRGLEAVSASTVSLHNSSHAVVDMDIMLRAHSRQTSQC